MLSSEVEGVLREKLGAAGVNLDALTPSDMRTTFDLVIELARERVSDSELDPTPEADMLLAQYGTCDWGDGRFFRVDVTRQFGFVNGEDSLIDQLRCEFLYNPRPELDALGAGDLWSKGMTLDAFAEHFREWPAFRIPDRPVSLYLSYDEV